MFDYVFAYLLIGAGYGVCSFSDVFSEGVKMGFFKKFKPWQAIVTCLVVALVGIVFSAVFWLGDAAGKMIFSSDDAA